MENEEVPQESNFQKKNGSNPDNAGLSRPQFALAKEKVAVEGLEPPTRGL